MPKSLMVVFSNPKSAAEEQEYNRWYTEKHLTDVIGVPGIVSATRYRLDKGVEMGEIPANAASYLALYEMEGETTEELKAINDALAAALREGSVDISPALDETRLEVSFAVPITETVA